MADLLVQTGFLDRQTMPFFYEVTASGADGHTALLLLHAFIADNRMWDQQVPSFAQHYRTVRYDLRGFGQAPFPTEHFSYVEDLMALLSFLHIAKVHVLGSSGGSKVALDFALTYPELVSALVLVAPSVNGTPTPDSVKKTVEQEDAFLEKGDLEGATEVNLRLWVDGLQRTPAQVDPRVRQRVHDMLIHDLTIEMPDQVEELKLSPPAITRLAEVQVPTLIVVGELDLPEKVALAQQLQAQIPQAQLEIIPGTAHMLNMEQPEEFNHIVLSFLAALNTR